MRYSLKAARYLPQIIFAVLLLAGPVCAYSQSTATLQGSVADPTGAAVAGAQITVHNNETGIDRNVVSDAAGNYSVPSIQPGTYSVVANAPGFSRFVLQSIT